MIYTVIKIQYLPSGISIKNTRIKYIKHWLTNYMNAVQYFKIGWLYPLYWNKLESFVQRLKIGSADEMVQNMLSVNSLGG